MARPFRGLGVLDEDGTPRAGTSATTWPSRPGTIAHIGLNFRPFYRYDEAPGRFHMLGIHTSPVGFVQELPRIHRAQPMRPGKTYEALSPAARSSAAPTGTVRYMIDGDLHEARGDLEIGIGPRVKLVVVR